MFEPSFETGTLVRVIGGSHFGKVGEIESFELAYERSKGKKEKFSKMYLIELIGGAKVKVDESLLALHIDPKELDRFLADSLLLTRNLNPERIDNTIKELLGNDDSV